MNKIKHREGLRISSYCIRGQYLDLDQQRGTDSDLELRNAIINYRDRSEKWGSVADIKTYAWREKEYGD